MDVRTCVNCGLPIVRPAEWVAAGHEAASHPGLDAEWVHKPHEITGSDWAWYFCTIRSGQPLSTNPHAEPTGE